jgi:hypothetical protein
MRIDRIFASSVLRKLGQDESSSDPRLIVAVAEFLVDHPDPDDEEMHEWAEENGIPVDDVEKAAYFLATRYAKLLLGGKSKGVMHPEAMDQETLKKAIKIEMEHTDDPLTALKIVCDHVHEHLDYYEDHALPALERTLKAGKPVKE